VADQVRVIFVVSNATVAYNSLLEPSLRWTILVLSLLAAVSDPVVPKTQLVVVPSYTPDDIVVILPPATCLIAVILTFAGVFPKPWAINLALVVLI